MMIDKIEFENQPEEEKSRYVDELLQTLAELEEEISVDTSTTNKITNDENCWRN